MRGTPVSRRTPECFPAENRDLFWEMDQVVGASGRLEPINFDANGDGRITGPERDAVRGRNTWLLWGGGNETFWGWLQERGYGIVDFLVLMDSRQRDSRFARAGLINQPGMVSVQDPEKRILGLYLDAPAPDGSILLRQPPNDIEEDGQPARRPVPPPHHATELFEPGDRSLYEEVRSKLAYDGLDPAVYGYPSGIFGLRLFLNPDFFGNTKEAARAREYWNERVVKPTHSDYYTNPEINADPSLIRPFRVSMSCGFCHVGPHPLNPPEDPENPQWANLSSIIGDQYWKPQTAFGNLLTRDSLLYHFLASQAPGTIDTSLVSTDHINNANTINAVFDLPARLERALTNSPELQSPANLLVPSIEEGDASVNPRHFPRVLVDGADSCGGFAALIRVPLNIGTFSEEWERCHNPLIGFRPQRPFRIGVAQKNSVYWQTNERYRVPYMAAFFTFRNKAAGQSSTAPMKLTDAPGGAEIIAAGADRARQGRSVFLRHCAICHSSRQPEGFQISFQRGMEGGWDQATLPPPDRDTGAPPPPHYTLPMDFAHWEEFKRSPAYQDYCDRIAALAGQPADDGDPFLTGNFMSSEIRIPVTLVGTNSGRATATNAMRNQVWDNFSSEGYKSLPPVGPVRFYNPFSGRVPDAYGNNDSYEPPGGGPGYYRPATLLSLWSTAPYLHNNTLGLYNHDPSVKGRLAAFNDGIRKLLWNSRRTPGNQEYSRTGDLRPFHTPAAAHDPGYIYRLPQDTFLEFPAPFTRQLLTGIAGRFVTSLLSFWLWVILAALFGWAAWRAGRRHAGILLLVLAVLLAVGLAVTGIGASGGTVQGAMIVGMSGILEHSSWLWWLAVAALAASGFAFLYTRAGGVRIARGIFLVLTIGVIAGGVAANRFINGKSGSIRVGPIPKGTPINLMMNLNPEAGPAVAKALVAMFRATQEIRKNNLKEDAAWEVFEREAGPALLRASKCPDFVLDRGHWFGEALSDEQKESLICFLRTL